MLLFPRDLLRLGRPGFQFDELPGDRNDGGPGQIVNCVGEERVDALDDAPSSRCSTYGRWRAVPPDARMRQGGEELVLASGFSGTACWSGPGTEVYGRHGRQFVFH